MRFVWFTVVFTSLWGFIGCQSGDPAAGTSDRVDGSWVPSADAPSIDTPDATTSPPTRSDGIEGGDGESVDEPDAPDDPDDPGFDVGSDTETSFDTTPPKPAPDVRDGGSPPRMDATGGPDDTDSDTGPPRGPGRMTKKALTADPWYGVFRVADTPAVVGSVQKIVFRGNGRVQLGFRSNVTGKWEIFGRGTLRLYNLTRQNGQPNEPPEYALDPIFENGYLEALQLYNPARRNERVSPHVIRWRPLGSKDVSYSEIVGRWQSKKLFTNRNGQRFRLGVRVESGGEIAYVIVTRSLTEVSRGKGRIITYETGQTMWFITPPSTGRPQPPFAGEIRTKQGNPVLYAPRFIEKDGKQGADDFESVELERVMRFQR